jgi:hypothetical protein
MSRFEQTHNQQMYSGIVFSEYAVALPETVKVIQPNTGRAESLSSTELVHRAQYPSQFTQQQNALVVTPLQKLSATGWQNIESEVSFLTPGVKRGG